jgi:hypothetical protein
MQHTGSASDNDAVQIVSTFAPLVTRPAGKGHWLRRERERRHLATPPESDFGDRVILPSLPSDERRPCRRHDESERGSWIAIGVLTAAGIAFLIFAILNPELIANTFATN